MFSFELHSSQDKYSHSSDFASLAQPDGSGLIRYFGDFRYRPGSCTRQAAHQGSNDAADQPWFQVIWHGHVCAWACVYVCNHVHICIHECI